MSVGLLRALVQNGKIPTAKAEELQKKLQNGEQSFTKLLFDEKIITPNALAEFVSTLFGYPMMDLSSYDPEVMPDDVLDASVCADNRILPLLKRGNKVFLAVADPTQFPQYQKLLFKTGLSPELVVVRDDQLSGFLDSLGRKSSSEMFKDLESDELFGGVEQVETIAEDDKEADGPVARFVHKTLLDAINIGASDIHFEFYEFFARIRFRIDGQLREMVQPPLNVKDQIATRIKVLSRLDISEKRIPQDGRMKLNVTKTRAIDFRVSTLPTLFGEKVVMRILDSSAANLNIDQLGFEDYQKKMLLDAIHRPYGMVLVTGPTGSGKTVSLYTSLNLLNKPDVNISTAEDPAEINLPGINQVNVNDKQGLTFAAALKSFLRQDPDIIMVGEIRDLETADIAIKAAQTGHMVFSTLHTNNAPATLSRMLNMGVAPFNIASSVNLIMAQRLLRRLCPSCKKPIKRPPDEALLEAGFTEEDLAGKWQMYGPNLEGCDNCRGKGYKGRAGIYELMPVSDAIQRKIMENGTAVDLADIAYREGMVDLRRAGLLKVMSGITSLEEVVAKTND
ncbi:MAG: type IV-A pilus assembly ATPase PilB [Neisseriaceae bacterium]|nr:type IV-A pilus assembly ATPase PilB [Neisseriaceae bacterium]MBP5788772.1 type IV-A pilus assembly ATPase PilB [Neisseriaceae bacterium]